MPREYARELDEKEEFPEKVWKALAEGGYLGIPIPEEYGGVQGDVVDMTIVTEDLPGVAARSAWSFSCRAALARIPWFTLPARR